jgi:hypothetical protein
MKELIVHVHDNLKLAVGSARNFARCLAGFKRFGTVSTSRQRSFCQQAIHKSLFKVRHGLVTTLAARVFSLNRFLEKYLTKDSYDGLLLMYLGRLTDGLEDYGSDQKVDKTEVVEALSIFEDLAKAIDARILFPCSMLAHFLQESADFFKAIHRFFYVHAASMDKVWDFPGVTSFWPGRWQESVQPCLGLFRNESYNPNTVGRFCASPVATPCTRVLKLRNPETEYYSYMTTALCCAEARDQSIPWV